MLHDQLLADQLALEQRSLDEGRERYLRQQKRIEDDQGYGSRDDISKVIKGCLPLLSSAIEDWIAKANNGQKGKTATAYQYLRELDVSLLASLTLTSVFSAQRKKPKLTRVLASLGKVVEDELWAKALYQHDGKLFTRLVGRATRTHGSVAYRRKAVKSTAAKEGHSTHRWTDDVCVKVAEPLLNALLKACPEVFEVYTTCMGKNNVTKWVGITDAAKAFLDNITETQSWMQPMFKPMIAPPRPWTDVTNGGYYSSSAAIASPLIKTFDSRKIKGIRAAIRSGSMAPCLDALNAIQATAWQLNQPIVDLVKWAWDEGKQIAKFPSSKFLDRPERPENYDELSDKEKKSWRIKAGKVAERNRSIVGEKVTVIQDLLTADLMAGRDFYIPHNLDFRGRVYAIPHFNQQRSDYVRAMLQFAEAKPLGEGGAYWLAVHLANCGDFDKISKATFDERVEWVERNIDMIRRIADDPIANFQHWYLADKPFSFVAACMDFAGYLKEGPSFCSRLAVSLDGSNSGLQHYSAALRSPEGAYVNLTPQERPADVYQAVADIVADAVLEDVQVRADPLASKVWSQSVTRKLVKRNVMTFAYSSAQFGFKQQLLTDLMAPINLQVLEGSLDSNPYDTDGDGGFAAAGYLAGHTWRAVNSLVTQAAEGMRFFQRCASALAHESKAVTWVTPVGLPVTHQYEEFESKTVKLFLYDKAIPVVDAKKEDVVKDDDVFKQIRLNLLVKPTKRINKDKARNAIAPNVIHSMDAAHLMLTVLDAHDAGIRAFSLIHDSFGTHAADTEAFFHIIRQAFVNMYESYCPFEELRAATLDALDNKSRCPDVPEKGTLDLQEVLQSDYAFA